MNEFHEMSLQASESANQDASEIGADVPLPVANGNRERVDSEEEEIDTGEIRM